MLKKGFFLLFIFCVHGCGSDSAQLNDEEKQTIDEDVAIQKLIAESPCGHIPFSFGDYFIWFQGNNGAAGPSDFLASMYSLNTRTDEQSELTSDIIATSDEYTDCRLLDDIVKTPEGIYFWVSEAEGKSLWITDGRESGTKKLKYYSGVGSVYSGSFLRNYVAQLTPSVMDSNDFFYVASDGTEEGTRLASEKEYRCELRGFCQESYSAHGFYGYSHAKGSGFEVTSYKTSPYDQSVVTVLDTVTQKLTDITSWLPGGTVEVFSIPNLSFANPSDQYRVLLEISDEVFGPTSIWVTDGTMEGSKLIAFLDDPSEISSPMFFDANIGSSVFSEEYFIDLVSCKIHSNDACHLFIEERIVAHEESVKFTTMSERELAHYEPLWLSNPSLQNLLLEEAYNNPVIHHYERFKFSEYNLYDVPIGFKLVSTQVINDRVFLYLKDSEKRGYRIVEVSLKSP